MEEHKFIWEGGGGAPQTLFIHDNSFDLIKNNGTNIYKFASSWFMSIELVCLSVGTIYGH